MKPVKVLSRYELAVLSSLAGLVVMLTFLLFCIGSVEPTYAAGSAQTGLAIACVDDGPAAG